MQTIQDGIKYGNWIIQNVFLNHRSVFQLVEPKLGYKHPQYFSCPENAMSLVDWWKHLSEKSMGGF